MTRFQRDRSSTVVAADATASHTAAFARLYAEFFNPIYWYCRSRLGDATVAEDATSTVFARALAAGPRYEDPALRSWIFAIAHNVISNVYRAKRPEAPFAWALDVPDTASLPEDAVVADDERDSLLAALRQLPDDQRRVVELRMVGLTGPEIARVLDRSHGAIKMLQLRAFAHLRTVLADVVDVGDANHG